MTYQKCKIKDNERLIRIFPLLTLIVADGYDKKGTVLINSPTIKIGKRHL